MTRIIPTTTIAGLFVPVLVAAQYEPASVHDVDLLTNGNILVIDGGPQGDPTKGGIFEIDRAGSIVWSFVEGLDFAHNADLQPDGRVIISDTGNDRVIIIDRHGQLLWDTDNITLGDGSHLSYPNDANLLAGGNRLITDRDNHRVIEIDHVGNIVWQFGQTGQPGGGPLRLNGPHNADRLASGNTIIADSNNQRIIEVSPAGQIVWAYAGGLDWPRDADRLTDGNTLINDSRHHRVIEVTPAGVTVWDYTVVNMSYDSDRLDSGNTMIGDGDRIIEVDPDGQIVWSFPVYYQTEVVAGYLVTAPNGHNLWTKLIQPDAALYPGQYFPAVINVPGGLGAGENGIIGVAERGFVEVHFNAEGRGVQHPSEGQEDYNGFIHQDDLKAVIEFAATRPNVLADNIGVVTGSYGITMGAGCLGRYPGLLIRYLVDTEGPSESFVTCFEPWALDPDPSNDRHQLAYNIFGHWSIYRDPSPENVAWWSEREATRFIDSVACRYVRVQAEWDHAQPPNAAWPGFDYYPLWYPCKHTVDMINLAAAGQAPWTRVNGASVGNLPNQLFGYHNPPVYYSQAMHGHPRQTQRIIRELAAMPPASVLPGDLNCDGKTDFGDINPFVQALTDQIGYYGDHPDCNHRNADINEDGKVNFGDINPFVRLLVE